MAKIAVSGAAGRMGRRIVALLSEEGYWTLACALERPDHPQLGKDAGVVAGVGELGVSIEEVISGQPDVLLDFTAPDACVRRAEECARLGTAMVVGTTGLSEEQSRRIEREVASRVPVLVAPNMSIGMNLLFMLAGEAAAALGEDYDVEIVESHHRRKKDAPSGTALKLAQSVCDALSWDPQQALVYGRSGTAGERPRRQIGIHALRGGDVVGDHTLVFAGEGERIELTHRASSRDVFARGALRAARFLVGQPAGRYDMKDLLSR